MQKLLYQYTCYYKKVESLQTTQTPCPFCSSLIDSSAFFCPTCGKNVKEKPLSTSILSQIGLYAVSILLPPLFIGWTIKYLKSADQKTKQIGILSLILTTLSLIIGVWISIAFAKTLTQSVNQQLNQYQDI